VMLIAGTIPVEELPLILGQVSTDNGELTVEGHSLATTQGTGALISAALATTSYLKLAAPYILVCGDTGKGTGSRQIYEYLIENIAELSPSVLSLHYCLPDIGLTKQLCEAGKRCIKRPLMIADAASMYSAKAAGLASEFDIFTPDASELAFLADPNATHPAYIARHLFDTETADIPELIATAYQLGGAAKLLLVKGAIDYIARDGEIMETVTSPDLPVLEAIGGTGDTITGMVSAFTYADLEPHEASIIAARANRAAGQLAQPTPATSVNEVIKQIPLVYKEHLCQWSGVCCIN